MSVNYISCCLPLLGAHQFGFCPPPIPANVPRGILDANRYSPVHILLLSAFSARQAPGLSQPLLPPSCLLHTYAPCLLSLLQLLPQELCINDSQVSTSSQPALLAAQVFTQLPPRRLHLFAPGAPPTPRAPEGNHLALGVLVNGTGLHFLNYKTGHP